MEQKRKLNRNIGCIEILVDLQQRLNPSTLNRNIGCIEIKLFKTFRLRFRKLNRNIGCIEILKECAYFPVEFLVEP